MLSRQSAAKYQHASDGCKLPLLQVLSCPPASCLPFGCPGHEFVTKGIQGCGVNTLSGTVGAQFALQFVVFNSAQPALSANVSRTIVVATPCAPGLRRCFRLTDLKCAITFAGCS
jgi:hypothetical protein